MIPGPPLPTLGEPWTVRIPRGGADVALIHRWMLEPHVEKFWHQDWPLERWQDEIDAQMAGDHSLPGLIAIGGEDIAYIEVYRVDRDRLAGHYPNGPRDLGVHLAIGNIELTGRGLGRAMLRAVAHGLLQADPRCPRVVAEPDSGNAASINAFTAAGFEPSGQITLPDKTAMLMIYERAPR